MIFSSSRVFSRSARILDEMPSSAFVSNSRKCRRLPNIMSRMMSRLHLSPSTSRERLIGPPEGMGCVMVDSGRSGRCPKNCLQYCISYLRIQLVAKCNQLKERRDGPVDHVESDDA